MKGLDKALIKETGLPVIVAPSPLLAVCLGTGKALEYLDKFKERKPTIVLLSSFEYDLEQKLSESSLREFVRLGSRLADWLQEVIDSLQALPGPSLRRLSRRI